VAIFDLFDDKSDPVDGDPEPFVTSRGLVLVRFGIPHLLYHQGTQLNYWLDNIGRTETAIDMMGDEHEDGIFVWSGHIHGWRSYEGEYDEELVCSEERLVTAEEWKAFTSDEIVWDFDEMRAYLDWRFKMDREALKED
jgi:hypothetical protein